VWSRLFFALSVFALLVRLDTQQLWTPLERYCQPQNAIELICQDLPAYDFALLSTDADCTLGASAALHSPPLITFSRMVFDHQNSLALQSIRAFAASNLDRKPASVLPRLRSVPSRNDAPLQSVCFIA
jgi:hypothetical protein